MNNLENDLNDVYFNEESEAKSKIENKVNEIKLQLETIKPHLEVFSSPYQKEFVLDALENVYSAIYRLEQKIEDL